MESQMARPHGQSHEQEPHIVGHQMEGEDEHHHDMKSVLKKVKAKARKIKDTFTKHGHDQDHDHDLDEEEIVDDPENHSAPLHEAEAIKSVGTVEPSGRSGFNDEISTSMDVDPLPPARTTNPGDASHVHEQEERVDQPKVNFGVTQVMDEAPKSPQNTPEFDTSAETHYSSGDLDPTRTFVPGQEEHLGQPKVNLQIPGGGLVEDPDDPKDTPGDYSTPSNYQSKVTDPTSKGGQEAIISPVLHSFDKMSIHDESKRKPGQEQNWPTGTGETFDSTRTQEHPQDNTAVTEDNADDRQSNLSRYTEKISSVASAIADKAISAKNVSKLGYGEQGDTGGEQEVNTAGDKSKSSMPIYEAEDIKSVGTVEPSGWSRFNDGRSTSMDIDPLPPARTTNPGDASHVNEQEERMCQPEVNFGLTQVMDEAPKAPRITPVVDTSAETDYSSIDHDPTRTFVPGQEEHPGQPKVNLQIPKGGLVEVPDAPKDTHGDYSTPSNYQSKVTDPTGRGGQEASITPVLQSFDKMSIHDESKPKSGQEQNWPTGTEESFDGTRAQEHSHDNTADTEGTFDSASNLEHTQDNPDDRQLNQSSYTEKISSVTSVTDEAISVKNVLASKNGHGEQGDRGEGQEVNAAGDKSKSSMPATAVDYGKKIAVTATESSTPVYEKVTGAVSTDISKMPGTNTGTGSEKEHDVRGKDAAVSVKGYFAEKLRPGEEDRALSEVISEALHKKKSLKEDKLASPRPVTEVISDALHKRNEEPNEATDRPMGKVTESEEVARRLGNTEHDSSKEGTNSSFVNRIKGAVGSWFGGKGEETHEGSQQSLNAPIGSAFDEAGNNNNNITEEQRLQESGN